MWRLFSLMFLAVFVQACAGNYVTRMEMEDFAKATGQKDKELEERLFSLEETDIGPGTKMSLSLSASPAPSTASLSDNVLVERIKELEKKVASTYVNYTSRTVDMNPIYFPVAIKKVSDLPKKELAKLTENAERIKEEKPSKVVITAWSDGQGSEGAKNKISYDRGKSVKDFYLSKLKGATKPEMILVSKIAASDGALWRKAATVMWVANE